MRACSVQQMNGSSWEQQRRETKVIKETTGRLGEGSSRSSSAPGRLKAYNEGFCYQDDCNLATRIGRAKNAFGHTMPFSHVSVYLCIESVLTPTSAQRMDDAAVFFEPRCTAEIEH